MAEAPEEKRTVTITIDRCPMCYNSELVYWPIEWVCGHESLGDTPREIGNPKEIPDWCPRLEKE